MIIHPVILCGGSGTRLWPLSRKSYPKQFARLTGPHSLFQQTVMRFQGKGFAAPLVLTREDFRFIVTDQLEQVATTPATVLIEPEGRNTAPVILAAALWLARRDPEALMLVAPSDHVIADRSAFLATVRAAGPDALAGDLVAFGITPDRPETGYGYLQIAEGEMCGPRKVTRFVEKPDRATAEGLIAAGNTLWNAGTFLMQAQTVLEAFKRHAPQILATVAPALEAAETDLGFTRLAPAPWCDAEDISIDYAIMERADNVKAMPYTGMWSDLGDWDSVWREGAADAAGKVCSAHAMALDCRDSLLRSESAKQELVGIGLEDMIVIALPDAVLAAPKSRAQEVGGALRRLTAKQATEFPRVHRPWGWFESLASGDRFQVKRIVVHPGAMLSLQSHYHRAEHWIVVQGTARVVIGGQVELVPENRSIYVPLGATHRLENPGKVNMILVEVQTGRYLGEDDIIRHEDVYARA